MALTLAVKMSRRVQFALVLLCLATAPARAQDCAAPQGPDEVAICGDYDAHRSAEVMPEALRFAMTALPKSAAAALEAQQRAWYMRLPDECRDRDSSYRIDCLRDQLKDRLAVLHRIADDAPRTRRACNGIAALADRGAKALHAADLVGRAEPVDLRNNGHPVKLIHHYDEMGTAHMPYLADETRQPVAKLPRDDYLQVARWAYEFAVVRVAGRVWEVSWYAGTLDDNAVLIAATDGGAVCSFRADWQVPTVTMLSGGERKDALIYHDLLLGLGLPPPSANLDDGAVKNASDLSSSFFIGRSSWRVDLMGTGQPMTLIRVELSSGAGRGCASSMLGLVQDGRVTALGLLEMSSGMLIKPLAPLSPALDRLIRPFDCQGLAETPVLDQAKRAYLLVDNTAKAPGVVDRIRLLTGARNGVLQSFARLSWQVRNRVITNH